MNAHMEEIINLFLVKGSNYFRVQEFYEKLSRNYNALQTLKEGQKLQGFVMTTLNKLPQIKPDLVRMAKVGRNGPWKTRLMHCRSGLGEITSKAANAKSICSHRSKETS